MTGGATGREKTCRPRLTLHDGEKKLEDQPWRWERLTARHRLQRQSAGQPPGQAELCWAVPSCAELCRAVDVIGQQLLSKTTEVLQLWLVAESLLKEHILRGNQRVLQLNGFQLGQTSDGLNEKNFKGFASKLFQVSRFWRRFRSGNTSLSESHWKQVKSGSCSAEVSG